MIEAIQGTAAPVVDRYLSLFGREDAERDRNSAYVDLVNGYYDLVTDFYERGWGQAFHFAPGRVGESFTSSILRHEHYLALRLVLGAGEKALDVGCGVGGPMRAIAQISGASIDGINNHPEQLRRLALYNARAGLAERCKGIRSDFMALDLAPASYDAAYAIEATCHAPDRTKVFSGVHAALRPGGRFAGYEWVMTDRYDPSNTTHRELEERILRGNGLPRLTREDDVRDSLAAAGFVDIEIRDVADEPGTVTPWYAPLTGHTDGPSRFHRHPLARPVLGAVVSALEAARIAPKGTTRVSALLQDTADALVEAGELGIFTPCLFFLGRRRN